MKKLFYKGKGIAKLSEEEASRIVNHKGITLVFRNQRLKASQVEVLDDDCIATKKRITEYTTSELKEILGNFETEYNAAAKGEYIHNDILGCVREGTIKYALNYGAITKKRVSIYDNKEVYFVKLPEFDEYSLKVEALKELNTRRDYAEKKEIEAQKSLR